MRFPRVKLQTVIEYDSSAGCYRSEGRFDIEGRNSVKVKLRNKTFRESGAQFHVDWRVLPSRAAVESTIKDPVQVIRRWEAMRKLAGNGRDRHERSRVRDQGVLWRTNNFADARPRSIGPRDIGRIRPRGGHTPRYFQLGTRLKLSICPFKSRYVISIIIRHNREEIYLRNGYAARTRFAQRRLGDGEGGRGKGGTNVF